jgi:bifunctional DNA-binding transcriptional regulator/antitoxin component of YhaV-PrlF toxin-antitoxin module
MGEIIFKGARVQAGYRIKIPKAVIDTLNLKISAKILIKFDAEKARIIVEEEKKK